MKRKIIESATSYMKAPELCLAFLLPHGEDMRSPRYEVNMTIAINKVRLNLVISKESEAYIRQTATYGQALARL
jgi:hypothetical protein